jgi:ribonuclease P protein component
VRRKARLVRFGWTGGGRFSRAFAEGRVSMKAGPEGAVNLRRLTSRGEFLRAARGNRAGRPNLAVQAVASGRPLAGIGLTVSKKVGNAPQRNRVKRRLRAAARTCAEYFLPQHDYVLVGRREALAASFGELVADLEKLIARVGATPPTRHPPSGRRNKGQ